MPDKSWRFLKEGTITAEMTIDVSDFTKILKELTAPNNPEGATIKHYKNREEAEYAAIEMGTCLTWCHCERYLCSFLIETPHPIHAYPEHDCAER